MSGKSVPDASQYLLPSDTLTEPLRGASLVKMRLTEPTPCGTAEPKKIGVMTINVCMSVAGVRNRHLPRDLALSAFTAAGIGIYLGLSKLGPWGWRSLLAGAAAQVPLTVVLCFVGGLPLTRLGSLCCLPFAWWDDWKHQRIDECAPLPLPPTVHAVSRVLQ
jgi:hypothetical protein